MILIGKNIMPFTHGIPLQINPDNEKFDQGWVCLEALMSNFFYSMIERVVVKDSNGVFKYSWTVIKDVYGNKEGVYNYRDKT